MQNLTTEEFKEKVFDYTKEKEWKFKGTKPTVIKFHGTWCQPCIALTPVVEKIESEKSEIDFYDVDVDAENELAQAFGVKSVPTMIYIPLEGAPQMTQGNLPKEKIEEAIDSVFLKS